MVRSAPNWGPIVKSILSDRLQFRWIEELPTRAREYSSSYGVRIWDVQNHYLEAYTLQQLVFNFDTTMPQYSYIAADSYVSKFLH